MSSERIPCTIAILTHNSAKTLPRALESAHDFAEIVICDGNSTDATLEIARAHGAHIIAQDPQFLHPDGRIANFAGVRNQMLDTSTEPWFFFLDSDEYLSTELVEEIRSTIIQSSAEAYWIDRKYVVNDVVVVCATTYPNRSLRLFKKAGAERFIKPIHERIKLKEGVVAGLLKAPLYVPVDTDMRTVWEKVDYYVALEAERSKNVPVWDLLRGTSKTFAVSVLYLLRLVRIYLFCRGQKMPLADELSRHVYNFRVVTAQWRARI